MTKKRDKPLDFSKPLPAEELVEQTVIDPNGRKATIKAYRKNDLKIGGVHLGPELETPMIRSYAEKRTRGERGPSLETRELYLGIARRVGKLMLEGMPQARAIDEVVRLGQERRKVQRALAFARKR